MHDDLATSYPDHGPAFLDTDAGRRRRTTRALVAGGLIAGFFLAGLGVAFARTASSHTTRLLAAPAAITPTQAVTPATPGQSAPGQTTPGQGAPDPGRRFGHGGPFGHGGGPFGGKLFGFGGFGRSGGLHGEFTIKKPDGSGYQTMATQTGEVTAVSPSSITVKSEDGFSRTYSVDENTVVGSGRDGIGSVKTGDTVSIAGVVDGGAAKAAAVLDSTGLGKIGDHWGFPKHK
jgi:hypothetical protein